MMGRLYNSVFSIFHQRINFIPFVSCDNFGNYYFIPA